MANESDEPFDVYCDAVQIALSPFDLQLLLLQSKATLKLGQAAQSGQPQVQVTQRQLGTVRLSVEHAKVVAILLKRNLLQYQEQTKTKIAISPQVAHTLELSEDEEW